MANNSPFLSKRGLIRSKDNRSQSSTDFDLSITIGQDELQRLLEGRNMSKTGGKQNSFINISSSNMFGSTMAEDDEMENHSIFDMPKSSSRDKSEMLFTQFLEVLQSRTTDSEVFDTIQDLIQTCAGILEELVKDGCRQNRKFKLSENSWLEQECNTWKLLHALYKDRLMSQLDNMEYDVPPLGCSEKEVISLLYTNNSTIREYQLVVDWLEACYVKKDYIQVGHTTDRTVGWENTLFQLQCPQGVVFSKNIDIVKSLDPDAPIRENKPLHALDEEDNLRLSRCIFTEIRQGKIEEAMALCKFCGQTWRAAILEGWRLHNDPNFDSSNIHEKMPIEGNPRRDIWKKCAWMMADSKKFDEYTRAVAGAFCGHLESMKALLNITWEDLLWAYLKVQIDIRVESEIRSCCMKPYHPMPEEYWNGKMSMEQIFDELSVHNDAIVRMAAKNKFNIIQKLLILDNVPELLKQMRSWVMAETTTMTTTTNDEETNEQKRQSKRMTPHMLRFLTHIVLFLRQINKIDCEEFADNIIAAYVECLIAYNDPQLIAFYTAYLPGKIQILLYSKFLETITDETEARALALTEALNAGLDIENITRHTVQTIRNKQAPTSADTGRSGGNKIFDEQQQQQQHRGIGHISEFDKIKIRSLEWLTFYPEHRGELLWQANAMIRFYLGESKIECMREVFEMIPDDSLTQIISIYGSKDNLPCREECTIKEYLSYKIYLAAMDCFDNWSHIYYNRPKEPAELLNATAAKTANFTERIASEHKEQNYRLELKRWKNNLIEQAKVTRDALYNVLLFPEKGWLVDPDTPKEPAARIDIEPIEWENRAIQMDKLRTICLPEIVLFLHKVLHLSGDYAGCVKLADDVASEGRQLYKVYTKHKMAELMSKLTDSSLALLNEKLDPWGFPITS